MKKINEVIALAEALEDRIEAHDHFLGRVDQEEVDMIYEDILERSAVLGKQCNDVFSGMDIDFAAQLPSNLPFVMRLLTAYKMMLENRL
jgi:hypothetical protein